MHIVKSNYNRIQEVMLDNGTTISLRAYGTVEIDDSLINSPHLLSLVGIGACAVQKKLEKPEEPLTVAKIEAIVADLESRNPEPPPVVEEPTPPTTRPCTDFNRRNRRPK